jgi:hypothetical protein
MTRHTIGTREEWLAARVDLLKAEKEFTLRGDEVARQRQELPWVPSELPGNDLGGYHRGSASDEPEHAVVSLQGRLRVQLGSAP